MSRIQRYPALAKSEAVIEPGMLLFGEDATGWAVPFQTATAGLRFLGWATDTAKRTGLPSGSFQTGEGIVHYSNGLYEFKPENGYTPKVGEDVYALDAWSFNATVVQGAWIGRVVQPYHRDGMWTIDTTPAYNSLKVLTV